KRKNDTSRVAFFTPTFCTMNGVTQPDGPPSIFVMFGRKIVVVGTPGVPQGAAETAELVPLGGDAAAAAAGRVPLMSVSASAHASAAATFLTPRVCDEGRAIPVSARSPYRSRSARRAARSAAYWSSGIFASSGRAIRMKCDG